MWWKKGIVHPGRTVEAPVSLVDIAPTLTDCAGLVPFPCSGRSLRPFLEDVPPEDWRREIYTQSNGNELYGIQRSVLTDRYHLIYNGFVITTSCTICRRIRESWSTWRIGRNIARWSGSCTAGCGPLPGITRTPVSTPISW